MDIETCCKRANPCDAVCTLENMLVDLGNGRFATHYKVGAESFSFAKPSISELMRLLRYFKQQCNIAQGKPARRRAKVCLVFGEHTCGVCQRSSTSCRCGR